MPSAGFANSGPNDGRRFLEDEQDASALGDCCQAISDDVKNAYLVGDPPELGGALVLCQRLLSRSAAFGASVRYMEHGLDLSLPASCHDEEAVGDAPE